MNDLSITQEYTICALNTKGKLSSFDTEKQVCFIAALVALLTKSQLLKTYFSDFERKLIKTKLHEISNSEASQTVKKMIDYVDNITMSVSTFTAFNMMQ